MWNLWHGCRKISEGCRNCYVYRGDARRGIDSTIVHKTKSFDLPVRRKKNGEYKIPSGTHVWTCFTSDFFIDEADEWRNEAWRMMRERSDLTFFFITKRVDRISSCLPDDWGDGYDNVSISCTIENQQQAEYRLPIYKELPIKRKSICCEPLLGPIDLKPLIGEWVSQVIAGGESGPDARVCHHEWVMQIREACIEKGVSFYFKQTGAKFVKDGKLYRIERRLQHAQARKAGINYEVSYAP